MLEGEKCILQGLPLTLPHISPLKHGHKGVFWLTLLQVGPKNPIQKGFALYQGPWLALSIWQSLGITWDTSLWVRLWGIVFTELTEVGGPAHCGWHHSLIWNPGLDKWRKGAEQQQTPFCASRPWVGCEQLCQVLLPWLPYHDGLLTCPPWWTIDPWGQNQSFALKFLSSEYFMTAAGGKSKVCPLCPVTTIVLTMFSFSRQTLLPIACFMRFYINISGFLKAFRFSFLRAPRVFCKILVIWIVSFFCHSALLRGVSITLVVGKRHLSFSPIVLILDFLQKCSWFTASKGRCSSSAFYLTFCTILFFPPQDRELLWAFCQLLSMSVSIANPRSGKMTLRPVQGWLDPQRDGLALRFDQLSGFIRSCLDWLTTVTFLVHWKWVSVQNQCSQIPKHCNHLFLFPQCTLTLVKGCISLWEMLGERLTVCIWGQF